jgi:6-methylsalicylate decarboxylase
MVCGESIELMDDLGIQVAVTSVSSPAANVENIKAGRTIARICNEIQARMIDDHPRRYGAFATIPLPDIEGTPNEIEYALNTLKFDGVELLTNYDGKYLGDSAFEEVYQELNRRKAVVHVHPGETPWNPFPCASSLIEAPFDTTRTISNLICSGILDRYQDISFIFSHGGGVLPYPGTRIGVGSGFLWPGAAEKAPKGFFHYLKRVYFDTAISATPYALPSLHALVDRALILFGSDFPFVPPSAVSGIKENIEGLAASGIFTAEECMTIEEKNALTLFPELAARVKGVIECVS